MAKAIPQLQPFFFIFLSLLTLCTSGTQVGFSYDARGNKAISSPIDTISFLRKNSVSPSRIKVFVTDDRVLKTLSNTGVRVDLFFNESQVENPSSWLKTHLVTHLPCVNITSIVVSSTSSNSVSEKEFSSLLATLKFIHVGLKSLDLNHKVKVSISFSLSMLENSQRWHGKDVRRVVDFIRKCKSFIVLETKINGALSMGDDFVGLVIKSATFAVKLLHYRDVPVVLNVKSSAIPNAVEVAEFTKRMMTSIKSHAHISGRISGVFAQISPVENAEQKELDREEEQIFHSSHRELLDRKLISVIHDNINPPIPITTPQGNPVPTIVTVPATNPVSVTPINPATNPAVVPTTTPMTVPPTNPVTSPSLVPPIGNQVPPFVTVPVAPPAFINPAPPTGGIPITPPVATPIVNPVTPPATTNPPTTPGQIWCVAKTGTMSTALQAALDYACGMGGADCSAIQLSGSCYNPNNPQSHASYAFNNYYQKNPAPSSCDFKGAAILVNTNPSTGSCIYPSSLSSSSLSPPSIPPPATTSSSPPPPASTTPSSPPATTTTPFSPPAINSLPPFMLNSSNPDSSTPTIYGSSPPPGSSSSVSIATGLQPLFASIVLVPFIITGRLCKA